MNSTLAIIGRSSIKPPSAEAAAPNQNSELCANQPHTAHAHFLQLATQNAKHLNLYYTIKVEIINLLCAKAALFWFTFIGVVVLRLASPLADYPC